MNAEAGNSIGVLTRLLETAREGEPGSWDALFEVAYKELHRTAASLLRRERNCQTLQPTALVHETFIRMIEQSAKSIQNRPQFFAIAARVMRRILVDAARRRLAHKRGDGARPDAWTDSIAAPDGREAEQVLELNELMEKLAVEDARAASVCEMRFFVGMELTEIAESMAISLATVKRDLTFAKAWLHSHLL